MGETARRYQETDERRFRELLEVWLALLQSEGFEGSVVDLETDLETMEIIRRFYCTIPTGAGLSSRMRDEATFIRKQGFAVDFRRTATARTIRVSRLPAPDRAATGQTATIGNSPRPRRKPRQRPIIAPSANHQITPPAAGRRERKPRRPEGESRWF